MPSTETANPIYSLLNCFERSILPVECSPRAPLCQRSIFRPLCCSPLANPIYSLLDCFERSIVDREERGGSIPLDLSKQSRRLYIGLASGLQHRGMASRTDIHGVIHECPFEKPYPCVAAHSPIQYIASSIVSKDRSLTERSPTRPEVSRSTPEKAS
jgi:hypothetical protein